MSAPEGAEAPSEDVDDPETEDDEPTIPLVAISAAIIKRHVALLLERLIQKAADSELFPHKPTAGTNSLRSQEKSDTAAAGSLIGLVHEILLGERWHPFSFQGTPGAHLLPGCAQPSGDRGM